MMLIQNRFRKTNNHTRKKPLRAYFEGSRYCSVYPLDRYAKFENLFHKCVESVQRRGLAELVETNHINLTKHNNLVYQPKQF